MRVPGSTRPPGMGVGHISARRLLRAGWLFDADGVQLSRQELEERRAREREQLVRRRADRATRRVERRLGRVPGLLDVVADLSRGR